MDPTQAITQIASSGILGALVIVLSWALWKKDRQLSEQSEKHLVMVVTLQREIIAAATKLSDLVEFIEKREAERERAFEGQRGARR